jgi:hypothetical protein
VELASIVTTYPFAKIQTLLPVPHPCDLGVPHLLLQLEDTVHQRLSRGGAARHVDVNRHNPVASSCDRVAVVVVTTTVCATTHGDDPARLGHLVVHLTESGCHLVGKGSSNNHHVGLARRSTENDTEAILIVSGSREMHHLDGAACKTERHGP